MIASFFKMKKSTGNLKKRKEKNKIYRRGNKREMSNEMGIMG